LTEEQLSELAPDASTLQRARNLTLPHRWSNLGQNTQAVWGTCQGSGQSTYQVAVDLSGPAFRCSCPSRQFPCKHALALLLLRLQHPEVVPNGSVPAEVSPWLSQRAAQASAKPTPSAAPVSERLQQRLDSLAGGLLELRHWLYDALRSGLADLAQQPAEQWARLRARLIDAQAPGLAARIETLAETLTLQDDPDEALEQIGLLYLYLRGFERWEALPPDLQAEYQQQAGISVKKQEVLQSTGVADHWLVLGRRVEVQERIDVQRTWLQGLRTGRLALLLDFAVGNRGFASHLNPGQAIDAELCYYPGVPPLRALARQGEQPVAAQALPSAFGLDEALAQYARALGQNPFLERYPLRLQGVIPQAMGRRWQLLDAQQRAVPLDPAFQRVWELLALSGGGPCTLMGEWTGHHLFPLGAREGQRWVRL
jgi:tetratricopeptide (TPR) repeat protein